MDSVVTHQRDGMWRVLNQLEAAGATLRLADDGRLKVDAPVGALTEELRAAVRERRDELVAWLERQAFDAEAGFHFTRLVQRITSRGGRAPAPHPELEAAIDSGDRAAFRAELVVYARQASGLVREGAA